MSTDRRGSRAERALVRRGGVIRKSGSEFIAWTDIAGQYREETRTFPDGRTLPVFVLTSSTAGRRFLLTNPPEYSLTYNGLVMVLEKRRSNGWQALGSYTFSRAYGLQASSGAGAADPQVSTVAPAFPTATFGRDPNNLTRGRAPAERSAHMFRFMGTVDVPHTGLTVSGNLQCFSGKPWAATIPADRTRRVQAGPARRDSRGTARRRARAGYRGRERVHHAERDRRPGKNARPDSRGHTRAGGLPPGAARGADGLQPGGGHRHPIRPADNSRSGGVHPCQP